MNLDDFISESLSQVMKGIDNAQKNLSTGNPLIGYINPKWGEEKDHASYTAEVTFDIAISVTEQKESEGKVGVKVVALEIGGGKEVSIENSRVSRISFKVPVYFPHMVVTDAPPRHAQLTNSPNAA